MYLPKARPEWTYLAQTTDAGADVGMSAPLPPAMQARAPDGSRKPQNSVDPRAL